MEVLPLYSPAVISFCVNWKTQTIWAVSGSWSRKGLSLSVWLLSDHIHILHLHLSPGTGKMWQAGGCLGGRRAGHWHCEREWGTRGSLEKGWLWSTWSPQHPQGVLGMGQEEQIATGLGLRRSISQSVPMEWAEEQVTQGVWAIPVQGGFWALLSSLVWPQPLLWAGAGTWDLLRSPPACRYPKSYWCSAAFIIFL